MKPVLKSIVKLCVCILIFMTVYPIIALLNGYLEVSNTTLQTVLLIIFGTAVFFLRDSLINRSAKPIATFFAPIFLIIIGVLTTLACLINTNIIVITASCIITLLVGLFAFFTAGREPIDLLSTVIISWITGIDLVAIFVITGVKYPYYSIITLVNYFLICAFRFVLANQNTLEELTVSRHYSFAALPQKIRSYNFLMIGKLLAITAAAFLLFRNLKAILTWLYEELWEFIKYIISKILSFFGSSEKPSEPIVGLGQSGMGDSMLPAAKNSLSWIWDILYYVFLFLILCGLVVLLVYLVRRLSKWRVPQKMKEVTPEYTDSEQVLTTVKKKQKKQNDNRRRWNKDYSAYKKMDDGEEKFHFGYSLAIRGLLLHGLPLMQSDTTCEIDSKSATSLQEQAYHTATTDYNIMVYGENSYTPQASQSLQKALSEIATLKMS